MKFNVTWLQEKTIEIDAVDVDAAETYSVAMINRLGGFPTAKLLSIYEIKPSAPKDDKPPTPFGKPPSGTLGGGQMKIAEALPDAVAA
jgi:hypothetical protein